jgi:outer membrane protein W
MCVSLDIYVDRVFPNANPHTMKKHPLALFLVLLLYPLTGFCQLEQGSFLGSFSGGFSYNHLSEKNSSLKWSTTAVTLSDNIGYFIIDKLAIGPGLTFELSYQHYVDKDNADYKSNSTTYSGLFDPFVRYYFAQSGKLAFFAQANGMIGYGQNIYKFRSDFTAEEKDTWSTLEYGGSAGGGLTYFLTKNIGLESMLAYTIRGSKETLKSQNNNFTQQDLNNHIALNVGLTFYFQRGGE